LKKVESLKVFLCEGSSKNNKYEKSIVFFPQFPQSAKNESQNFEFGGNKVYILQGLQPIFGAISLYWGYWGFYAKSSCVRG
jgi:hypothetical protein